MAKRKKHSMAKSSKTNTARLLRCYVWLVDLINRSKGGINLDEIQKNIGIRHS